MYYSSLRITAVATALLALAGTGCHVFDYSPRYAEGEIGIFDDLFSVSVPEVSSEATHQGRKAALMENKRMGAEALMPLVKGRT